MTYAASASCREARSSIPYRHHRPALASDATAPDLQGTHERRDQPAANWRASSRPVTLPPVTTASLATDVFHGGAVSWGDVAGAQRGGSNPALCVGDVDPF